MKKSQTLKEKILAIRESIPEKQSSAWTKDEKRQLAEMFYDGVGITEMAIFFERSEPAIINMLDDMKMYVKKQRHRVANTSSACKCPECELFTTGRCEGGKYCKKKEPLPSKQGYSVSRVGRSTARRC